ncbi:MAG: zinc metallopeptidase, partial [Oscillospiraceae bacterium]
DPRARVVRLSTSVYGSPSIASLGVAAHETGHAVQHANSYAPLVFRNAIIPVTNLGSRLSMPMILLGLLFSWDPLITLGILCFGLMTVFQLITLPVEFNASSRAMNTLAGEGILDAEESAGAKKVLSAAALTYVAALLVSAAQLLRLVLLFGNRRRD